MDPTLIVICTIMNWAPPGPLRFGDHKPENMACTQPMPLQDAKARWASGVTAKVDQIAYTLREHKAPLSSIPKSRGWLSVYGNPEEGRVVIHWDSALGGPGKWSGTTMGEDSAVATIDQVAREHQYTNPVAYDLVRYDLANAD